MKKLLFVDCLIREENSRTKIIADAFLSALSDEYTVEHLELAKANLIMLDLETLEKRDELLKNGKTDDEMFLLSHSFAHADAVLVAAPFWDLSFPALLKVYFENICVCGITFYCDANGMHGMCKGKNFIYITTKGGYYGGSELEQGSSYMKAMSNFFGFEKFECIDAEGLDVIGADVSGIIKDACKRAKEFAESL